MDVQCERCKVEYVFDDALVSGRGTTVRCSECGHQFKIRREGGTEEVPDQWVVLTADGMQHTFVHFRDLQQAILSKKVLREDLLQRGASPARPLGEFLELAPLFDGRRSSRPAPPQSGHPGDAALRGSFSNPPLSWEGDGSNSPNGARASLPAPFSSSPPRAPSSLRPSSPAAMRGKMDTLRPPLDAGAAPPPPEEPLEPQPLASPSAVPPAPERRAAFVSDPRSSGVPAPFQGALAAGEPGASASLPPPTRPVQRVVSEDEFDHPPRHARPSLYDEPYSVPRRRRVGGWIVALSLLLAVGVVGWAVAKPYLVAQGAAAAAQLDPRAQSFLVQGESAMSDGSLDVAQEDFDKASVLAEKDPRVLLDRARVTAARADLPWLKLRLLTPDAADETRITQAQLDELVARARRQADDAFTASPNDFAALCARVDSLRLSGDREAARALAGRMTGQGLKPETAYVLAALDLAEPSPLWSTVIERLRLAASAEGNAGRARSALIYALVRAGDVAGARAELARLDLLARPYALLANLHAFVDRAVPAAESKPSALASASARAGLGRASTSAPPGPTAAPPGVAAAGTDSVGDPRNAMALAGLALKKGDFARARQVYEGIVDRNPADSEAIAGLGDVARLQGDPAGAMASYKHAIAINPSYLPALIGLADTQWSGGDHESAVRTYNSIVDRFPEGTYPGYVSQRLAVSQAKPADSPPASSAATSEAADRQGQ